MCHQLPPSASPATATAPDATAPAVATATTPVASAAKDAAPTPTSTPTTTATAMPTPASCSSPSGLPDFSDVAIAASVSLFHAAVCFGYGAAAAIETAKTWLCPIAPAPTQPPSHEEQEHDQEQDDEPQYELPELTLDECCRPMPTFSLVDPYNKVSPAVWTPPAATLAAASMASQKVTLFVSSHNVSPKQRAKTQLARDMLNDLLVVFEELDAATCVWAQDVSRRAYYESVSGKSGVYPLLFVEPTTNTDYVALRMATMNEKATGSSSSDPETQMTAASELITPMTRLISLKKLEVMNYVSGYHARDLLRLDLLDKSALVAFQDVASRSQCFTHGISALSSQLRELEAETQFAPYANWTAPASAPAPIPATLSA